MIWSIVSGASLRRIVVRFTRILMFTRLEYKIYWDWRPVLVHSTDIIDHIEDVPPARRPAPINPPSSAEAYSRDSAMIFFGD